MTQPPSERYTCITCRNPIGHKDFASLKEKTDLTFIETYHCIPCARNLLKNITFKESVEKQVVLKWIGKTWSFEMPLYEKDVWDDFQKALEDDKLFPEDPLIPLEKAKEAEG